MKKKDHYVKDIFELCKRLREDVLVTPHDEREGIMQQVEIHFSDLAFARHCIKKYHINRGIYNTIDEWFYQKGLVEILLRRKTIIHFLHFINRHSNEKSGNKFGHGGLSFQLNYFWKEHLLSGHLIHENMHGKDNSVSLIV